MIQLYLANQLFNIAVQRTVYNRQVTLMRGMAMLQSYYHGRRIGRGTLAFAERERKTRRLASSKDKMAGKEGEAASTADNTATSAAATTTTTTTETAPPPSTAAENAEAEEPPLRQCMQEAEYNFARGFHQMGMNQQAMLHYRRVLELPSWKEVEMQQALETKRRRRALREARRMESAEARDARIQMQLKRREEIRERKAKKKEEAKEARAKSGEAGVSQVGGEVQTEEVEEEEEDDEKFDFEEDDLDDESTDEDEEEDDDENKLSKPTDGRIRLQDDSTDLKREAAFNLAKIYMQSGAVGQARLLIHKYCTI